MRTVDKFLANLTFGIELEGGWNTVCDGYDPNYDSECEDDENEDVDDTPCHIRKEDGSVSVRAEAHSGEIVSPVLHHRSLPAWIRNHYPDRVNSSCGLHVHMGNLPITTYSAMMHKGVFEEFCERLDAWGHSAHIRNEQFWARLAGDNNYCRREYTANSQVYAIGHGGARYSILNYCWGDHQTLECRVLPMFKTATAATVAVQAVINILAGLAIRCAGSKANRPQVLNYLELVEDSVTATPDIHLEL